MAIKHEASEENAIGDRIIKSVTAKCDREVVAKMEIFRDSKAKKALLNKTRKSYNWPCKNLIA